MKSWQQKMHGNWLNLITALFVGTVVAVLATGALTRNGGQQAAPSSRPPATPTEKVADTPSNAGKTAATSSTSSPSVSRKSPTSPPVTYPDPGQLIRNAQAFTAAYFSRIPSESASAPITRVKSLKAFVSDEVFTSLKARTNTASLDNTGLEIQGRLPTDGVRVSVLTPKHTHLYVVAKATIDVVDASGNVRTSQMILTGSEWQFRSGTWVMTYFTEGGDE